MNYKKEIMMRKSTFRLSAAAYLMHSPFLSSVSGKSQYESQLAKSSLALLFLLCVYDCGVRRTQTHLLLTPDADKAKKVTAKANDYFLPCN